MTRASCQVMAASNSGCEHLYRRPCGCVTRVALSFLRDDVYGVIILGLRRGAYQSPAAAVAVAAFVLAMRHPDSPVVLALRVQLAHRPPSAERAASARADQPALARCHSLARCGGDSRGAGRHRGRSPDAGPVTRPASESQPGALFPCCVGLFKIVSCFARWEVLNLKT